MITIDAVCKSGLKINFKDDIIKNKLPDDDQVEIARKYIREYLTPSSKAKYESYYWKHRAEEHYNHYLSNGAFIVACILEGIEQEGTVPNGPNTLVYAEPKKNKTNN